ncbi:MAG: ABC transporter ATP-binding protein [Acidobacteriota bacterium]|nr:ABC transporter ATP-binding protein [Blastocatellia bacterium]MDW8240806.1 ABC transporter ATP-binding protein [Acidobacteriota bacterium]
MNANPIGVSCRSQTDGDPCALIELRGLTKSYRDGERVYTVLCQVNATIHRGELTVLIGRSGSGKSTVLNLISGIDLPDTGDVIIDGVNITALSEEERTLFRRQHIGFVFQFFNLVPTLTVEENVLLPLELNGGASRHQREAALEMLACVGLADRRKSFPDRLSGGEQQRVAIVRALAHDPLLVLADEPTGNLDLETGLNVLEWLDRLTRQAGKTMVMVTHAQEVIGLADRLFTIHDGHLIERDIHIRS